MGDNTIRLTIPADPEYSRVARTAVAGLALRLGFSYPAIEDLRLALDEALILLLRPDEPESRITLLFEPTDGGLVIDATGAPADGPSSGSSMTDKQRVAARRRFERLVAPIVDSWSVSEDDHHVHLVKTRP